jgi:hypothetical protein
LIAFQLRWAMDPLDDVAMRGGRGGRAWARLIGRLALAALAVAALILLAAPRAAADSTYRVFECQGTDLSRAAPDAHYSASDGSGVIQYGINCPGAYAWQAGWGKGAVLHPTGDLNDPHAATISFHAPPTTYFDDGGFAVDIGGRYSSCASNACWFAAAYLGNDGGAVWGAGMAPDQPQAYVEQFTNCGPACTRIWADSVCPGSFCPHFASPNDWYYDYVALRQLDLTVVDTQVPSLAFSGSLFDGPIAHGTPTLAIDAADRGSGVATATVDVNGVRVAAPPTSCPGLAPGGTYATQFRPCDDLHTSVGLDTERSPWRDGQNMLLVCVTDVNMGPGTGNESCLLRSLQLDNSCPDSSGATGQADSITAGLENPKTGQLERRMAVRSSEGTGLRGQLSGHGGAVRGASVCIYETVDEPAGIEQLVQVAKSSSSGKFGVQLPGGPSRTFRVAYRYGNRQLESPSMYLDSSVMPSLRLTRSRLSNGHSVGFRGRIPGPGNDARGVTLQARVGKKWRSFKQLQTDPNGNFSGKYRFTQTHGRVLYVFRALVKKQGGYPYSPGASKKRKLLVQG